MRLVLGLISIGVILAIYWQFVGPELSDFWYLLGWVVSGVVGWLVYSLIAEGIGLRKAGHNS